jgi:hypothetical protein
VQKVREPGFNVELLQCGVWKFVDSMADFLLALPLLKVEIDVRKHVLFMGMKPAKVGLI